ncbi:hypothetical protein AAFN86_27020 [Roseomonas sp. CAU 1739]|uniref:hypothetical protein n=1 Tax=Roseomonas sp. CAU 1739 TaxID=3140364 RepID=UPI00325B1CE6
MSEGIAATPRLSPQAAAAATAPVASPVVLVELAFASGPIRAWTGRGPLHWAGVTYEGMGTIGAVSDIEETAELRAVRITLTLSPVPQEVVDIALAEQSFRLRPARLWGALLDAEGAFVADPFPLWAGLMDTMQVVDGAEARISLTCESRLVDLERAAASLAEPLVLTTPTVAMRLASDDEGANPTRPGRFTAITIRLEEALP